MNSVRSPLAGIFPMRLLYRFHKAVKRMPAGEEGFCKCAAG